MSQTEVLQKDTFHQNSHQTQESVDEKLRQLERSLELAKVLKQVTDQIRSTLDLQITLQTITREVQNLLETDRVVIYQFSADWKGSVVVESVTPGWISVLGEIYADECFPKEYAMRYREGRIRIINDVETSDLNPCHKAFLREMQVHANLVVPIGYGSGLWGLLIAQHCKAPRIWQPFEVDLLQQLADQAAIAIHQAELYEQSQAAAAQANAQAEQLRQTLEKLQQTQSQLIQTEKMSSLGQLVAGVAHEINNPVNFIYGNLNYVTEYAQDLLNLVQIYQKYNQPNNPEVKHFLEQVDLDFIALDLPRILSSMRVGADRIRQIVLALRNFSRFDQADRKQVDIHEGLESTLMILQHRFISRSSQPTIEVIKQYGSIPQVDCYAGQLNQVFMNILSNAIDALEEHLLSASSPPAAPSITIRTELIDTNVVICITDNGPGMPPEVQARIFDPFFTTKPVGQGTGLGLAISYQVVVEKHGGALWCQSQPGEGTKFWIKIPVQQP